MSGPKEVRYSLPDDGRVVTALDNAGQVGPPGRARRLSRQRPGPSHHQRTIMLQRLAKALRRAH
jgi:hypothetical protein